MYEIAPRRFWIRSGAPVSLHLWVCGWIICLRGVIGPTTHNTPDETEIKFLRLRCILLRDGIRFPDCLWPTMISTTLEGHDSNQIFVPEIAGSQKSTPCAATYQLINARTYS